jgi:hypothetical protein
MFDFRFFKICTIYGDSNRYLSKYDLLLLDSDIQINFYVSSILVKSIDVGFLKLLIEDKDYLIKDDNYRRTV